MIQNQIPVVPVGEQWLALWDIDGVLANETHRVHFALRKQWGSYFAKERMAQDTLFEQGSELLKAYREAGWDIAYLTGRRMDRYDLTARWLEENGLPDPNRILMRTYRDRMPLADFKVREIQRVLTLGLFERVVLFDDDPEVIRLVQENFGEEVGVHCTWHIKPKALVTAAKG